jgi:TolB-like protein
MVKPRLYRENKVLPRLLIAVLLLSALGGPAVAQEPEVVLKKVAVFPFTIASKEPLGYLGDKVRQEINERLKADGFTLVSQEDLQKELSQLKGPLSEAQVQEIGRKLGADIAIWGALLKVGDLLSLEASLVNLTR